MKELQLSLQLGTWPKLTEQLFQRTFSDVCKVKASGVLTSWCSLTL